MIHPRYTQQARPYYIGTGPQEHRRALGPYVPGLGLLTICQKRSSCRAFSRSGSRAAHSWLKAYSSAASLRCSSAALRFRLLAPGQMWPHFVRNVHRYHQNPGCPGNPPLHFRRRPDINPQRNQEDGDPDDDCQHRKTQDGWPLPAHQLALSLLAESHPSYHERHRWGIMVCRARSDARTLRALRPSALQHHFNGKHTFSFLWDLPKMKEQGGDPFARAIYECPDDEVRGAAGGSPRIDF